jgi:hypothetical protein
MANAGKFLARLTIENTIPLDGGSFAVSFDPDTVNTLVIMREMCQNYVNSKVSEEDVTVRNVFGQARRDVKGRIGDDHMGESSDMNAFRQAYIDNLRI